MSSKKKRKKTKNDTPSWGDICVLAFVTLVIPATCFAAFVLGLYYLVTDNQVSWLLSWTAGIFAFLSLKSFNALPNHEK